MALPQYNNEELINSIKRRCSVPTSQLTFTNEDFVQLANDEMQGTVVPLLMSAREEYFVDFIDVLAPGGTQQFVTIPNEAVGAKLRSVCYVQQDSPLVLVNLPRIDLDIVTGVGFSNMHTLAGFYIQGNKLQLYPANSVKAGQKIRLYFYKRSLDLADVSMYGQILSIDVLNKTVVLNKVPNTWKIGTKLNAVSSQPHFNAHNSTLEIVNLSSPSVILNNVDDLEVGDYISDLGYSAIPQIPIEAHAYLAQLTAVKCLEGLGDMQGMQAAQAKADTLKVSLLVMVSQRVDGSVKKVMSPNGGLRLRAGVGRYGRRLGGGSGF